MQLQSVPCVERLNLFTCVVLTETELSQFLGDLTIPQILVTSIQVGLLLKKKKFGHSKGELPSEQRIKF
uniref:Ovule protein n=1 Tax=Caenorhabditis tropicalis TaxID=1561998 RepID=A0A1I7T0H2_9PELO